ncbi:MAG TPA: hypothetical protein VGJ32_01140 [Solirubrobacteraceae bacterium]
MHRMKRRPSPGMVIALIALVVAGSGTAVAKTLMTSADVRDGSLTGRDIKDHTIAARDLSRSITFRRAGAKGDRGEKGDTGDAGPAGAEGGPGAVFVPLDTTPAFPQQVVCRIVLPEDQDDTGRQQIGFNEQATLEMFRVISVTADIDPTVELNCWQPKRTGKGDGIVITGARVILLRVQKGVDLNPDVGDQPDPIPAPGAPTIASQELHFNNTDERILIKGRFQDANDAEANGVPNPAKDDLATNIVDFTLGLQPGETEAKYMIWARVRTDKVRRSTDKDATGQPTKQAPHVQADEDAEPLQSKELLP